MALRIIRTAICSDSPNVLREWAGGANWYLNRAVKIMADFDHTRLEYIGGSQKAENAFMTRLQLVF